MIKIIGRILIVVLILVSCAATNSTYKISRIADYSSYSNKEGCANVMFHADQYIPCPDKNHDWGMTGDGWTICLCK